MDFSNIAVEGAVEFHSSSDIAPCGRDGCAILGNGRVHNNASEAIIAQHEQQKEGPLHVRVVTPHVAPTTTSFTTIAATQTRIHSMGIPALAVSGTCKDSKSLGKNPEGRQARS